MRSLIIAGVSTVALVASAAIMSTPALAAPATKAMAMHASNAPAEVAHSTATRALNLLEAKGYSGFTDFHSVPGGYAAKVMRNGKSVTLKIDSNTNTISQS